ncbi:hypothetical protein F511_12607 [Dorcoceras hygrometricum]|uniref:Uncharacterized protein n=1 Tax=Dorcoceras hygrometricum TaxID=472368 RepID=A0A2Z7C6K9_9LAMI|nr:hypothetical protein F511_12607 [Dorcoceras hygrometricum]
MLGRNIARASVDHGATICATPCRPSAVTCDNQRPATSNVARHVRPASHNRRAAGGATSGAIVQHPRRKVGGDVRQLARGRCLAITTACATGRPACFQSTTIGKSRVAIDPIAMHTSWRLNSDITSVTSIGYPRMSASGEYSTTMHRLLHASGSHPIPTPYDPKHWRYSKITSMDLIQLSATSGSVVPLNSLGFCRLNFSWGSSLLLLGIVITSLGDRHYFSWGSSLLLLGIVITSLGDRHYFSWGSSLLLLGIVITSLGDRHYFSWGSSLLLLGIVITSLGDRHYFSWGSSLLLLGIVITSLGDRHYFSWGSSLLLLGIVITRSPAAGRLAIASVVILFY